MHTNIENIYPGLSPQKINDSEYQFKTPVLDGKTVKQNESIESKAESQKATAALIDIANRTISVEKTSFNNPLVVNDLNFNTIH